MVKRIILAVLLLCVCLEIGLTAAGKTLYFLQTRERGDGRRDKFRIIALGESTTQGSSGANTDNSYPAQLEANLAKDCARPVEVINLGVAGLRSVDIASRLPGNIAEYKPDLAVTMIGINDFWAHYVNAWIPESVARFAQGLHTYKLARMLENAAVNIYKNAFSSRYVLPNDSPDVILAKMERGVKFDDENFPRFFSQVHMNQSSVDVSIAAHERVLRVYPRHAWAKLELGDLFQRKGDFVRAEKFLLEAVDDQKSLYSLSWFYVVLAKFYHERGAREKFDTVARTVTERFPWAVKDFIVIATMYMERGEFDRGLRVLESAKLASHEDGRIEALIARLYARMKDGKRLRQYEAATARIRKVLNPETEYNYQIIVSTLLKAGVEVVAMEYPMRAEDGLRAMLSPLVGDPRLHLLSNELAFKAAVKKHGYEKVFYDSFGGDFGHSTLLGNQIMGEHLGRFLLEKSAALKSWCGIKAPNRSTHPR